MDFVGFVGPVPGTVKLYVMVRCARCALCVHMRGYPSTPPPPLPQERHDPVHRFRVSAGTVALQVRSWLGTPRN